MNEYLIAITGKFSRYLEHVLSSFLNNKIYNFIEVKTTSKNDPPTALMMQKIPLKLRALIYEVFRGGTEFRVAVELLYKILSGEKIYYRDLTASYRIVVAKLRRLRVLELIKDVDSRKSYLRIAQHFLS